MAIIQALSTLRSQVLAWPGMLGRDFLQLIQMRGQVHLKATAEVECSVPAEKFPPRCGRGIGHLSSWQIYSRTPCRVAIHCRCLVGQLSRPPTRSCSQSRLSMCRIRWLRAYLHRLRHCQF